MADAPGAPDAQKLVSLEWPADGVALVTLNHPTINNHGSWEGVAQLADALEEAREAGARVVVLASGVAGHWFEHAWLKDLRNGVVGEPTTGDGSGWFRCLTEIGRLLRRRGGTRMGERSAHR